MRPKYISLLLVLVTFILIVMATMAHALTPQERTVVEALRGNVTELKNDLIYAAKANESAIGQIKAASDRAEAAADAAKAAEIAAAELTTERDNLHTQVAVLDKKLDDAKKDHDKLLAHYHRFKGICASVVGLLVAFSVCLLILRFAAPALNTLPGIAFAFGIPVAVGAAVGSFIMAL